MLSLDTQDWCTDECIVVQVLESRDKLGGDRKVLMCNNNSGGREVNISLLKSLVELNQ